MVLVWIAEKIYKDFNASKLLLSWDLAPWLFAGSDRGGERAAASYSPIVTAKLNGVDPQTWLADTLRRINNHPIRQLEQLLPWNWKP